MGRMRYRRTRLPMIAAVVAFVVVLLSAYGESRTGMRLLVNSAVVGLIVYAGAFLLVRRRR